MPTYIGCTKKGGRGVIKYHRSNGGKASPLVASLLLGLLVFFATLALGAVLLSNGFFSESATPYLGGVALFLTTAIGGLPLASKANKKLWVACIYGVAWGLALLLVRMAFWNQAETFCWWPLVSLLAGAVVAGLLSSRSKKLAY